MTIWEAKETFEEKGIKYKFYDCYAGNNDKEFVLFNTAVLLPQGLSMRYAIYASDKSNWHILNLENTRDEFLDLVLETQQVRDEYYENECIKLHKATNKEEQCLIDSINKNLADLLLEKTTIDKTAFGMDLREIMNSKFLNELAERIHYKYLKSNMRVSNNVLKAFQLCKYYRDNDKENREAFSASNQIGVFLEYRTPALKSCSLSVKATLDKKHDDLAKVCLIVSLQYHNQNAKLQNIDLPIEYSKPMNLKEACDEINDSLLSPETLANQLNNVLSGRDDIKFFEKDMSYLVEYLPIDTNKPVKQMTMGEYKNEAIETIEEFKENFKESEHSLQEFQAHKKRHR